MAQRRMFSKSITNSSQFLMMPQSSQNLYFHLGMNADDDGFCEHFALMRMTDSKPDDLKILQSKGFVSVFDDKVLIITDWKENNYLRSDRYSASKYLEIYKEELKGLSSGIPEVDISATQVRLGKDRIGNKYTRVSNETLFNIFWEKYPPTRKQDKQKCIKKWNSITEGNEKLASDIVDDIVRRKNAHADWIKNNGMYVPAPLVYLNNARWEAPIVEDTKAKKVSAIILN